MIDFIFLSSLNYSAIFIAGLLSFGLGALWYSPILFSKIWQKEVGLSDTDIQSGNMMLIFGGSFVCMLIMSLGLAISLKKFGMMNEIMWYTGALQGLLYGIMFSATSIGINYLYQRKSWKLFIIDAGYQISFLMLSGFILALWN